MPTVSRRIPGCISNGPNLSDHSQWRGASRRVGSSRYDSGTARGASSPCSTNASQSGISSHQEYDDKPSIPLVAILLLAEFIQVTQANMKVLKRSNGFYDSARFGQPQIRLRHRTGRGVKSPSYVLRCGCCDQRLEIHYADDGLEIGGVNGALKDWREILLPLLLIEPRGRGFVDVSQTSKKAGGISSKAVQRTGASRSTPETNRPSSAAGSRR